MSDIAIMAIESVITFLITFAVTWGALKTKLEETQIKMKELEVKHDLSFDRFVTLQQFNTTIAHIMDEQTEMRRDVKRILEILLK